MYSSSEKQLFKLREDAGKMQARIMELTNKEKLKQIRVLSKATMTDEGTSCHYDSSISVTDSATQVDFSPPRREVKDAGVSPIRPAPRQTQPPTHTREAGTQTLTSAPPERPSRGHRRARSEGDSLFYERKAREAFRRVKKISRQLRDMAHPQGADDTRSGGEVSAPELISQSTEPRAETLPLNQSTNSQQPHKCSFQQQVKTLQRKLRSLNKQVCVPYLLT